MYAESFNVRGWLEEPAKWLRWAIQSGAVGKVDHERFNLQQFWKSLQGYKGQARTQQDWYEVLTLDAESQEALGDHLRRVVEQLQQSLAGKGGSASLASNIGTAAGGAGAMGLLYAAGGSAATGAGIPLAAALAAAAGIVAVSSYLGAKTGESLVLADVQQIKDAISRKGREAEDAYAKAEEMSRQATDAYRKAGLKTPQQASQTQANAASSKTKAGDQRRQDALDLTRNTPPQESWFSSTWFGLPMWAWLGIGATAAVLLVPSGTPTINLNGGRK